MARRPGLGASDRQLGQRGDLARAHAPPQGLSLLVADAAGRFRPVRAGLGFPAGKDKTVLVDLAGRLPRAGPRRVRLATNLEIFWDRLGWAVGRPDVRARAAPPRPRSAELRARGYSVTEQKDRGSPERPRYVLAGTAPRWRDLEGYHTRFGDVRELLGRVDDRYVIMNAGDEMRLRFRRGAAVAPGPRPRLRPGRRRLGEGRRLQHHVLAHRAAAADAREPAATTAPRARSRTTRSTARTAQTSRRTIRATCRPSGVRDALHRDGQERIPMKRYPRPLLALVFVGLLATPLVLRRMRQASPAAAAGDPLAAYGFRLTESAKAAGLDFVHEGPTLDPKLAHIMPQVTSMGAAVAVVDFDADGHPDLYVTNSKEGSKNRLYRNRGDGTLRGRRGEPRASPISTSRRPASRWASVWGDYDNDGFEDLLLYRWGRPELFHNDGGKGFTRASESAGLPAWANVNAAVWLDFDRDGRLDFFLGGYYAEQVNLWKLADTKMMPESFEYAKNGGRKYLYRNLGGGRFEEVSEKVGLASRRWALAAVAADLRGSGYPDLFIANDYGVSELFVNEGGRFREVGKETGVGYAPRAA